MPPRLVHGVPMRPPACKEVCKCLQYSGFMLPLSSSVLAVVVVVQKNAALVDQWITALAGAPCLHLSKLV